MSTDSFAVRLMKAMARARMTSRDLNAAIGMSLHLVNYYQSGKMDNPRMSTLVELCKALDCSADYLIGLSDDPQRRQP